MKPHSAKLKNNSAMQLGGLLFYRCFFVLYILILISGKIRAQEEGWEHDPGFRDDLLYLHVLENYSYDPAWISRWENNKYTTNNILLNFGSVEINDLFNDIRILINQPLDSNWVFLTDYYRYSAHFVNKELTALSMGFQRNIGKSFGLFMQVKPAFDKEWIDGQIGISYIGKNRNSHLRVALQLDQFVYQDKNNLGGKVKQSSTGVIWSCNMPAGKFRIYSEGRHMQKYDRIYPDSVKSGGLSKENGVTNYGIVRGYYQLTPKTYLRLEWGWYRFSEGQFHYAAKRDFQVDNEIQTIQLLGAYQFDTSWDVRFSWRFVKQQSKQLENQWYKYNREEHLPAFWLDYKFGKHNLELGIMKTYYSWQKISAMPGNGYDAKNNIEKIRLGYGYRFNESSRIILSLSHVISAFGFGGFDLNYLMFF